MTRRDPDWALIRRITRITAAAPGGGLHRTELADRAGVPAHGDAMKHSLLIAYQYKRIDFCGQWVVKPARPKGTS
jgi:hypothetical protein